MKTPIEELVKELQNGFLEDRFNCLSDILILCVKYQSLEERELINAFNKGYDNARENSIGFNEEISDGVSYYNQTFSRE